jgi:hypothetical protein
MPAAGGGTLVTLRTVELGALLPPGPLQTSV